MTIFNGVLEIIITKFFFKYYREGAVLRQLSDGRHLIQLIYDADQSLQDCEYITDIESATRFQETLAAEYRQLSNISLNTSIRIIERRSDLPEDLARLAVYRRMKIECRQLHSRMRKAARQSENPSSVRYVFCVCVNPSNEKPIMFFELLISFSFILE